MLRRLILLASLGLLYACSNANSTPTTSDVPTSTDVPEVELAAKDAVKVEKEIPLGLDPIDEPVVEIAQAATKPAVPVKPKQQKPSKKVPSAPKVQEPLSPKIAEPTTSSPVVTKAPEQAQEVSLKPEPVSKPTPPSHTAFSALLKQYVTASGQVDYAKLKANRSQLDDYLSSLSKNTPADSWNRDEKLAYWINAYNAATLQLIINNYPLSKITDLDGGKPWDVKRIKLGDKTYSLNQIEHDIIRPTFKDARIHFAVNCAAASCPPLRNEAYVASRLNSQLEEQTEKFISNTDYNKISGNEAKVSKLFDWYAEDFGNPVEYLAKYSNISPDAKLTFNEYNWKLNAQ